MLSQVIKMTADATAFQRGVAQAATYTNKAFKSVTNELTGRLAGAFAAGAVIDRITGFASHVVETADRLGELSEQLNISIEDIQRLQVAANLAGMKFPKLEAALQNIANLQAQAMSGDKRAQSIFGLLGIDPSMSSPVDVMRKAIEAAGRGTREQGAAADLFGRKLGQIRLVVEELNKLGPIDLITDEQSKRIGKAKDDLEEAYRRMTTTATPAVTGALRLFETQIGGAQAAARGPLSGFAYFLAQASTILRKSPLPKRPEGEIGPGPSPQMTTPTPAIPLATQGDALSRIGLFVGGAGMTGTEQLVSIGNYQLSELRRIRATLEHANQ